MNSRNINGFAPGIHGMKSGNGYDWRARSASRKKNIKILKPSDKSLILNKKNDIIKEKNMHPPSTEPKM